MNFIDRHVLQKLARDKDAYNPYNGDEMFLNVL